MEELLEILNDMHPEVDFENTDDLIDGKILDSIDIISIVAEISDVFGVDVPAEEIVARNFNSARALWDMIQRLDEA